MAITSADLRFWKTLQAKGKIPESPTVLEIGEANWYGDISPQVFYNTLVHDGRQDLADKVKAICDVADDPLKLFRIADVFWQWVLGYKSREAWDFHGTPSAKPIDLNRPDPPESRDYDIIINNGTLEHVFNIGQAFETIHDFTRPGGLMAHCFPFTGWFDHGFWTISPTLVHDLAKANDYALELCCIGQPYDKQCMTLPSPMENLHELAKNGKLPADSHLYFAWRKTAERPFRYPMQSVYAADAPAWVTEDWRVMR